MEEFNDKTVLITGATGLIGSNLVDKLMQSNVKKLIVTSRKKSKLESTFYDYLYDNRFVIIEHDASTPYPDSINDVDFIFHAAGPMERNIVMAYPVNVILPNITGTINALDFLRKQKTETGRDGRAIIFSSVAVYNNPTMDDLVVVEDETNYAQTLDVSTACYSESKRMSEVIAKSYVKQYDVDVVIARLSTVYGPTRNIPDTAFYEFIRKAVEGLDITVNTSNTPKRDNIFVEDAVDGILTVALKGIKSESYNISSNGELGNYLAIDEIAEQIIMIATTNEKKMVVNHLKPSSKVSRKPGLKLSNEKLKALGWSVKISHEEGIKRTIAYFKNMK